MNNSITKNLADMFEEETLALIGEYVCVSITVPDEEVEVKAFGVLSSVAIVRQGDERTVVFVFRDVSDPVRATLPAGTPDDAVTVMWQH